jgi:hypothetical protein
MMRLKNGLLKKSILATRNLICVSSNVSIVLTIIIDFCGKKVYIFYLTTISLFIFELFLIL